MVPRDPPIDLCEPYEIGLIVDTVATDTIASLANDGPDAAIDGNVR